MASKVKKAWYMPWSKEQMESAICAIVDDGISISAAAREFNVPRKTLSDKINNNHPLKPGRQTCLSTEMEDIIVKYIQYMYEHAFPLTIPND